MPIKRYKMSEKRKLSDLRQTDFDKRIEIFMLRNQGWSYGKIGKHLCITRQHAEQTYKKMEGMSIEQLEYQRKLAIDSAINKDDTRS